MRNPKAEGGGGSPIVLGYVPTKGSPEFEDLYVESADGTYVRRSDCVDIGGGVLVPIRDLIEVTPSVIKVFSTSEESEALTYLIALSVQTKREAIGLFAEQGIIILPTVDGIAIRDSEDGTVKKGDILQSEFDNSGDITYCVDIRGSQLFLNRKIYDLFAYIHTHPKDPMNCLGGAPCFVQDKLSQADFNFSEKNGNLKVYAIDLTTNHIVTNDKYIYTDMPDPVLKNPDTNVPFTYDSYFKYLKTTRKSLIYGK
jgi:hypothetical protein